MLVSQSSDSVVAVVNAGSSLALVVDDTVTSVTASNTETSAGISSQTHLNLLRISATSSAISSFGAPSPHPPQQAELIVDNPCIKNIHSKFSL